MDPQYISLAVQMIGFGVVVMAAYFKLNQYHMTVNSKMDKFMELLEQAAFARGQKAAEEKAVEIKAAEVKGEESVKTITAEVIETEVIQHTGPKPKSKAKK